MDFTLYKIKLLLFNNLNILLRGPVRARKRERERGEREGEKDRIFFFRGTLFAAG